MLRTKRKSDYEIEDLILNRWSPRAMTGESIADATLFRLFEAARWAPSSYNGQPWRFIYAKRDTEYWQSFFDLLVPFNQSWCNNAAVLMIIVSKNNFDHNDKPARTHSFDTGSAWENLALQAAALGLVAHGLEGFDYEKAHTMIGLPKDYTVEAMCAIGVLADPASLPESLREREKPSERKPITECIFEGTFNAS